MSSVRDNDVRDIDVTDSSMRDSAVSYSDVSYSAVSQRSARVCTVHLAFKEVDLCLGGTLHRVL